MIILGGLPSGIVFGPHGITPAQIAVGSPPSPLLNDVDPGDDTTELLWRLEPAYVSAGVTTVSDTGVYGLSGAPDGTYTQPYRLFELPAAGAPTTSVSSIVTVVGGVAVAPSISVQPQPQTVNEGAAAAFAVTAAGTAPLTYQWRRNGVAISGATSASYVLASAQTADNGAAFSVLVSNGAGSLASNSAALTVAALPVFTVQPTTSPVTAPSAAVLTFNVSGADTVQAQRRSGALAAWADVTGATSTGYTTPPTSIFDNGAQFRIVATNDAGASYSSVVTVTVSTQVVTLVNPRPLEDLLYRVLPFVRNCPPQTAVFHLREAARDFFQRTLAWRQDLQQLQTAVGQADYTMALPQQAVVAKLLSYAIDRIKRDVIDAELGIELQFQDAGTQLAWSGDRQTVTINPPPAAAGRTLDFRVALKPSEVADDLPGAMAEHYVDNIADGAIARLLEMPGCDWTNPKSAVGYRGKYELAVARVSRMSAKGFSKSNARRVTF